MTRPVTTAQSCPNDARTFVAADLRHSHQFGEVAGACAAGFGDDDSTLRDDRWRIDLVDSFCRAAFEQAEQDARRQRPTVALSDASKVFDLNPLYCTPFGQC